MQLTAAAYYCLRESLQKDLLLHHAAAAAGHTCTAQIVSSEQQGRPPTFLAWKEARFSRSEDSLSRVSSLDLALQWVSSHYSSLKQTPVLVHWPFTAGYADAPALTISVQLRMGRWGVRTGQEVVFQLKRVTHMCHECTLLQSEFLIQSNRAICSNKLVLATGH